LLDSVAEQDRICGKLSAGGTVTQPLQETFWGARFGMVTDKFGIPWMLNCDLPKK
jgi:PhnB protein